MTRSHWWPVWLVCVFAGTYACATLGKHVPTDAGAIAAQVHPLTVEACNACEEARLLKFPLTPKGEAACAEACAVARGLCGNESP